MYIYIYIYRLIYIYIYVYIYIYIYKQREREREREREITPVETLHNDTTHSLQTCDGSCVGMMCVLSFLKRGGHLPIINTCRHTPEAHRLPRFN
jgi:hypothetical protein